MRLFSGPRRALIFHLSLLSFGALFILHIYITRYNISDDFYIEKGYLDSSYILMSYGGNNIVVSDVSGWILSGDYIYGGYGDSSFFVFKVGEKSSHKFISISELNVFLIHEGLNKYDISAEENVSNLKYGGMRDRKY